MENLSKIIVNYKYYTISIKNQIIDENDLETNKDRYKTYKLLYKIEELEKIDFPKDYSDKQKEKKIKQLRNGGQKIITKKKKINGKIIKNYYRLYSVVEKDFNYRLKLIELIYKKPIYKQYHKIDNNELFLEYQTRQNIHKTTKDHLQDEYSLIVDIINTYLLTDEKLANSLNGFSKKEVDFEKAIKKSIERNKRKTDNIYRMNAKQKMKWKKKYKKQYENFKKSKTHKLNSIYYSSNDIIISTEWDWINKKWIEIKRKKYNVEGLIDVEKPYTSKWCLINTDNEFYFENQKYIIDKKVKQYKVKRDNQCEMDKILCIKQDGKIYFFDMNIDQIDNKLINGG